MLGWFLETTLVCGLLALVALFAGRVFRLGPAGRHALWLVVLVKLLIPPVVAWPRWRTAQPEPVVAVAERADVVVDAEPANLRPSFEAPAITEAALDTIEPDSSDIVDVAVDLDFTPEPMPFGETTALLETEADEQEEANQVLEATTFPATFVSKSTYELITNNVIQACVAVAPWAFWLWALGTAAVASLCAVRIGRFAWRVHRAEEAPEWLRESLMQQAAALRVQAPSAVVTHGAGSPLLWCLGAPKLVVPADLVCSLPTEHWDAILAHELAHIRRGDPWVERGLLAALLVWWWNPIYWLTRARLQAEAELACDAQVVARRPSGRRKYAEALIEVCALMNGGARRAPAVALPALGVDMRSASLFFERRLTMILRGRGDMKNDWRIRLGAGLLAALALPTWSLGQDEGDKPAPPSADAPKPPAPPAPPEPPLPPEIGDDDEGEVVREVREREVVGRRRAEVARRRAQVGDRRREVQARLQKLQAERQAAQARFQARMQTLQQQLEREMKAAAEAEARVAEEAAAEDRRADIVIEESKDVESEGAKAADVAVDVEVEVDEAMDQVNEALKEVPAAVQEALKEVPSAVRQAMKELEKARPEIAKELENAKQELKKARPEIAKELENAKREFEKVRPEIAKQLQDAKREMERAARDARVARRNASRNANRDITVDGRPMPPTPPVPPRDGDKPRLARRDVDRAADRDGTEQLERRIEALESRFDSVLEEIRALRKDLGSKPDADEDDNDNDNEGEEDDGDVIR